MYSTIHQSCIISIVLCNFDIYVFTFTTLRHQRTDESIKYKFNLINVNSTLIFMYLALSHL